MVDVAAARPTMSFFDQSQDLGAVIAKINLMAADINASLFGRAPAQPRVTQRVQAPAAQDQVQARQSDQPDIHAHPEKFDIACYKHHQDLSHLRWVVDEPEDLEFVTKIYEKLYPSNPEFETHDIVELLQREPELIAINKVFKRNEVRI